MAATSAAKVKKRKREKGSKKKVAEASDNSVTESLSLVAQVMFNWVRKKEEKLSSRTESWLNSASSLVSLVFLLSGPPPTPPLTTSAALLTGGDFRPSSKYPSGGGGGGMGTEFFSDWIAGS